MPEATDSWRRRSKDVRGRYCLHAAACIRLASEVGGVPTHPHRSPRPRVTLSLEARATFEVNRKPRPGGARQASGQLGSPWALGTWLILWRRVLH